MTLAIDARQFNFATKRCRGEGDRHARQQGGAIAFEYRMTANMDEDVKIARWRTKRPRFALPAKADPGAGINTGRDGYVELLGLVDPPFPATLAAGFSITSPRPWQVGQVRSTMKKPCWART